MKTKFQWWKLIAGYVLFVLFHQINSILGGGLAGKILGESFESVYSHMKMYFYAYLVLGAIDHFLRRKEVASPLTFWTTRALIASSFPWMAIVIWFIPIALGFDLGRYELAYSLIMTPIGLYLAIRMDEGLEGIEFRPSLRAMIWLAFAAAFITYTGFSFQVPDNFFKVSG